MFIVDVMIAILLFLTITIGIVVINQTTKTTDRYYTSYVYACMNDMTKHSTDHVKLRIQASYEWGVLKGYCTTIVHRNL